MVLYRGTSFVAVEAGTALNQYMSGGVRGQRFEYGRFFLHLFCYDHLQS